MNFIKRAGLYCFRQRVRTVILFMVFVIISVLLLTGMGIRDASDGKTAEVGTAVGGRLYLDLDSEGHMGGGQANAWGGMTYSYNGDFITKEIVEAIAGVDGVVACNSEDRNGFYGAGIDFKYLPAAFNLSYTPYGACSAYTATLSSEQCSDFESGKYTLVEGRHIMPSDSHVVMISKELAAYNKLNVGDKLNMYCLDSDSKIEFEIVGIFDGTEGMAGNALTVDEIPANCGYVDYAMMFDIFGGDMDGYQQLTIYAEDPVSIQNVYDRIAALPELEGKSLKLSIDTQEYDAVSAPLESLRNLADTMLLIISFSGAIIITLLLTVWVRGRKKEIGILLSAGCGKGSVIAQFFAEVLFTAAAAFAVSVPLGRLTAGKAGELLNARIMGGNLEAAGIAAGNGELEIIIPSGYLLPVCLFGLALTVIAAGAASWSVIRLRPKDILSKMS